MRKTRSLNWWAQCSTRDLDFPPMYFEIVSEISEIQTVAVGSKIYEIERLRKQFGHGRWRKLKGIALVKLPSGRIRRVELHWYEAHGIGKRKMKIKRYLDQP